MKYKKTFLIIFFLSLFVFQQVQASANILPNNSDSQTNLAQGTGPPAQIYVNMLHLDVENDGIVKQPREYCVWLERAEGCGEANTQYPYTTPHWALVDVENDYLLNVLPREMDVATNNPPTLEALQAQAVAARSLADWKDRNIPDPYETNGYINNSRDYQLFIPYAYNYYSPSNSDLIDDAVILTSGQYLSYNGESIDAEFGADMKDRTISEPAAFPKDYLKGVEDPISNDICGASDNSNRFGMSQLGAYRWSNGNQCATGGDPSTKWSVTWTDYRQILAHYYTGIDILGPSGKVAPDDRWNLLNYAIPACHFARGEESSETLRFAQGDNFHPDNAHYERINPNPKRRKHETVTQYKRHVGSPARRWADIDYPAVLRDQVGGGAKCCANGSHAPAADSCKCACVTNSGERAGR